MPGLRKELTLFDVYAVSTGAMFSAGFFLLPGLAAAKTGPAVMLAYVAAGLLLVPSMLSMAELSTAMPRAGGMYFVLDRSLGPMMGTIGGFGTWLSLIFKSAFALIGIGAYLSIFVDVPVRPVAVGATVLITILNVFGAKETTRLQRFLVVVVLAVLLAFIVAGLGAVLERGLAETYQARFDPAVTHGVEGFIATIGFVFVSFAGILKVASISEEVKNPDRTIPLGMALSLATAIVVYAIGVFVMVAVLPASELYADLTPVATAGEAVLHWVPAPWGVGAIVAAAVFAFAAMSNAGLMSASRYPLAMARDHLLPRQFERIGRVGTPVAAIVLTATVMVLVLVALDVESVAKLASALMLMVFGLANLAVVVMRETQIASYDPGYRSPAYPWMQILGMLVPFWLIAEMGQSAILFTTGVVAVSLGWYFYYARDKVARGGAIFHVFERLGRKRFEGLDRELRGILKEKGAREEDPFDEIVGRAAVLEADDADRFDDVVGRACEALAERVGVAASVLREQFFLGTRLGDTPVAGNVALPHLRLEAVAAPELVLARSRAGLTVRQGDSEGATTPIHAVFFLVSPESEPGQHLRILAEIAGRVDDREFIGRWLGARGDDGLKAALLGEQRFLNLWLRPDSAAAPLIGRAIRDVSLPESVLIAMIHRQSDVVVPRGETVLREGDRVTLLGEPAGIRELQRRYGGTRSDGGRTEPPTP